MKLQRKTIRNISIPVILMTICCLILFYNSDTTYTEATPVATGNTSVLKWAGEIGKYSAYRKDTDKNINLNLFCIQKGEAIKSTNTSPYTEYNWEYDDEVFKDEDSYNKLTWIKDNFWEQTTVSTDDKYTTEEKIKILKTVSSDITEVDIENVFNNSNEKFKLYQYITWTYAKNKSSFNPNDDSQITKYLGGKNTSLYKVYTAIINLAEANYKNTNTSKNISIAFIKDAYYDDESGNYIWEISINNSYLMPYNMNLKVNGENYDKSKYSYSDNKLVISGLNKNNKYSFEVLVDVYSVTTTKASIWKHADWQNMIEIRTTKEYDYAKLDSSAGEVGAYNFSIRKYDSKDNTKNLSNMQFEVQAPNGTQTYTTNDNGIAEITTEESINDSGTIYTYIINEIPEQNSTASNKTNTQKYVKLKEPVKIELVSGVTIVNNIHINYISEAHFENGQDEFEATLVNGKTVKLTLENNVDNTNAKSTITLNIPNTEKIYDLALTKTIIQNSYNPNLDYNFNGKIDMQDASIFRDAIQVYNSTLKIEDARQAIENLDSVVYEKYSDISDIRLMYMLDYDRSGVVDTYDQANGISAIYELIANTAVGNDIDRVNNVNDTELNNKSNESYITTSSYNMNKQTYKVAKGDIVLYRINVYNEGDYDAKEIEVTDHIPEGLNVCSMAGDTTLNTNNQISVTYNGGTYTWTISNNGRTAKCTINDTISAYEKNSGLQNKHVYIACKVTDSDDFKVGDILYNVAEITASTAVKKDGTTVAKQGDGDSEIKDRDSSKDSIKQDTEQDTEQGLIDKYETSFLETSKDSSVGEIDKNIYDYQDDDDFERVEISNEKLLDLALRKSISKIGTSETSMNDTEGRIPVINENTTAVFDEGDTTGAYIHPKEYVTVDYDGYVEYTIRIYNEGGINDYSGYAKQITDYLPNGIEFYAVVNSDGSWIKQSTNNTYTTTVNEYGGYEVIYDAQSNKVTINCNNVKTLEPTDYLSLLEYYTKNNLNINSYYSTDNKGLYAYQEVKLICKVTENAEASTNLTNIAEITEYVATDNEGNVVENVQDKDSKASTVQISSENKSDEENEIQYTNLNTYYEYKGVEDEYFDYYAGWQDDDDFETIQVNLPTGTYNFEITKIDESGNVIENETTEFKVEVYKEANEANGKVTFAESQKVEISNANGVIDTNNLKATTGVVTSLNGIQITSKELADTDKTYYFVITETKAPDKYTAIDYKVVVPVTYSQNGSTYEARTNKEDAFAVSISDNTKTDLNDNETDYNKATVEQTRVTINVKVPNEKIKTDPETPHKGVKEVANQDSGYYGDEEHEWVIQTKLPETISDYKKYVITDPINTEKLNFSGIDKVKVSVVGGNTLVVNEDYQVTYNESTSTLEIAFVKDNFKGNSLQANQTIEIRFNTTFKKDENGKIIALNEENEEVENQATLTYDNGSGTEKSLKTETPEVHTGAVAVYKYNEETNEALEGARFKIATSKENAQKGEFVKDKEENDLEAISNSQGIATFTGLQFGGDAKDSDANKKVDANNWTTYEYDVNTAKTTYYIVETEAPEGFNKCEDVIEVEVSKNTTLTEITNMTSVANNPKEGTYDFEITKIDESGNVIENETTEFKVEVYKEANEANGKVTFAESQKVEISNANGVIDTNNLKATTGVVTSLKGIQITSQELADADKTYYFVITETKAPDKYTAIDYKVVVPVTYSQNGSTYVATTKEEDAFAVRISDNNRIDLNDSETDYNKATVEQTAVTINVKVPNKIQTTTKTVEKKWDDNNNQDGTRPDSIKVTLYANDAEYVPTETSDKATVELNESNEWKYTWNDLPMYENGTEIEYKIKETEQAGYTTAYEVIENTTTITNTPITGNYNIKVKKVDENSKAIKDVTFSLKQTVNTNKLVVNEGKTDANGYTSTYTNNIVKDNVDTIDEYELTEDEVPDGYLKLAKPITISVSKKLVTENNQKKYAISELYVQADESTDKSVSINYNSTKAETKNIENVLLSDGKTTATIKVTLNESGVITIQITNISVVGNYNFQLYKTYITKDNEEKPLTTAKFQVKKELKNSSVVSSIDTTSNGYSKIIEQNITKEDSTHVDKYTITEISTGVYGISGLKNNIIIEVTKGLNSNETEYIIKSITAYEEGKTGTPVNISETQGANISINDVELTNGSTVNLSLDVNGITGNTPNQTMLLKVVNKQIPNKYKLEIKKTDKFSGEAIEGRTFEIYDAQGNFIDEKTTLDEGFATMLNDIPLDTATADTYYIRETYAENYDNKYIKIENYEWRIIITKKRGDNNDYVISNCFIDTIKIDGKEDDQVQKSIAEEATVEPSDDGSTVIVTIPNQPYKEFKFEVNKVDSNGTEISGSKFKIVREASEDKVRAETQGDPNENSNGVILTENVVPGESFVFKISETQVPEGYKSLFVDENGYVGIKVTIDSNGNVNKDNTTIIGWRNAIQDTERNGYIQEYLTNTGKESILEVDTQTNTVTINIPNPSITTDIKLLLNKHSYGDKTNKVAGAEFSVRRANVANAQDNKSVNSVIALMNNSANTNASSITTNTTNYSQIDYLEGINTNNTYYYEIIETKTPTNFNNKIEGVVIKVVVDSVGNVTANLIGIKPKNQAWVDYSDSVNFADRASLWNQGNNTYRLDFANDMVYQLHLYKKSSNSTVSQIEKDAEGNTNWTTVEGTTANFTIKKVEPVEEVIKDNETISDAVYVDDNAQSGVKYKYTFVEESSNSEHKNLFEGKTIAVYVTLNKDGTINQSKNSTYVSIEGCTSTAQEKYFKDLLELQIENNTVNLYVLNSKNKLNIKLMKVADKSSDRLEGAKFSVIGPNQISLGEHTTDSEGYIYLNDIDILGSTQTYIFTETEAPEGVTKLENTQIVLTIDTTGISSESELTADRITVATNVTGAGGLTQIEGLTAELIGDTVLLTVPNKSRYTFFNIEKTDMEGNRIYGVAYNDDKLTATEFNVSKISDNKEQVIFSQILTSGLYGEGRVVSLGNMSYEYKVQEVQSKDGYVNILEGWDVFVHVETDANGKVIDTENNGTSGHTYFYLKAQDGKTQKYTEEEIRNGNYITLDVIDVDITGASLAEGVTESRAQKITLHIKNPYEYKLQLQKTDLNGNSAIATLKAENITKGYSRAMAVNSYILHEELLIEQNVEETWKITEVSAKSPYINMLKGHEVFVTVKLNSDKELVITNFNIDGDEISELKKYVEPTIEKINGVPTLSVTVKNPLKYYIQLEKLENDTAGTPMTGANLTITNGDTNETRYITTLDSATEPFENEVYVGKGITYTIKENSTQTGHINVLKDKTLYVRVEMDKDYKAKVRGTTLVDSHGQIITGEERNAIMQYIEFDSTYTTTGFQLLHIKVKNPVEVKFKLTKKDTSGNDLEGTQIKVTSNMSGAHYINGNSTIEFTETDLAVGNIIKYTIEEINTVENSAYVNVFNNPINIIASVSSDGTMQEVSAYMTITSSNGEVEQVPLSDLDFVEYYKISDPDSTGIQTIELVLQNPTKFDFELVKKEANKNTGEETNAVIKDTKFRITSSFSGEHLDLTNDEGIISFTETDVKAGDYSFKIQEVEVPDENYVNILENKYIMVNVHVAEDGTVTFKDEANKYTLYESSGTQITDTQTLDKYKKYIDVNIDDSSVVYKIKVLVRDPVKIGLELDKVATDGTPLGDAEFSITSSISNKTETALTSRPSDSNTGGNIVIEEPLVDPGLYTFEITENETSNDRYENVLENCKIVVYVRVNSDGSIDLVDSAGYKFSTATKNKFYIQNSDGTAADKDLYNYVSINTNGVTGRDRVYVRIKNPVKFHIDIAKYDSEGNEIDGSKFTVYRNDAAILRAGSVSSKTEIEENKVSKGKYTYYITESASPNSYKYINVLSGKFIKLDVDVQADGTVSILDNNGDAKPGYFEVYKGRITDGNPTLIDKNDDIYSYIKVPDVISKDGEPSIVQVKVENPTQYKFNISKRNAANATISGSKFTAIREDENGTFVKILDNTSNLSKTESPIRAGNYIYYITENQSPGNQYINILEGKYIKMYISVTADGKVSITNSKFQPSDGYYELYKGNIETRDGQKIENSEFITVEAPNPLSAIIYTVKVNVINPIGYIVDITKKDASNTILPGAEFISVRENVTKNESTEIFSGEVTTNIEANETLMRAGNYIYYFTETKTPGNQYNNILKGKYVKVYVKVAGDGKVIITDSKFKESAGYYEIYEGNINNRTDSDKYISNNNEFIKVGVTTDGTIYTIGLEVINPVKYNVNINKKIYGEEEINLENVKLTLVSRISGTQSFITDENGNTPTYTENEIKPGIYEYLITENETASEEFVNILQNKGVLVFLKVNSDGTIEIVNKDHKPFESENKYYICDITDPNNLKYLNNDIATKFVKVYTSTADGVAELNFAIKNPQKYNFSIIKKDKDTDERMNGIAFELTTYNNGKVINLKDANTLQNINTTNLVTANVNGEDGVINVNNILFEKCGTYVFQLHEKAIEPSMFDWLYKEHKEDIIITIQVTEEDGQYVISNEKVDSGMEYLDSVQFTDGLSAITTEVMNERIKGKYDLTIDKLDSYTETPLDGAVFNIEVEDESGQKHDLYKSTDNVNSKDVILPDTVTINNGKLEIKDIRIDRPETYIITLTETVAPKGYMLLDEPIKLKVTTTTDGEYDDEKFILEDVTLVSGKNYELVTLSSDENTISLKIKNEYFDLALRKSITSVAYPDSEDAKITEDETKDRNPKEITKDLDAGNNDTTAIYNHEKNPVRVYKGQEVIYTFRVYNEGEIDGYAEEITDHLPEGLEFLSKDEFNTSRGWTYDSTDTTLRTVKTTNLSKQYGEEHNQDNLIKARNKVTGELDYKEIQIKCIVSDETKAKTTLTNIAEISEFKSIRTSETIDRDSQGANVKIPETEEAMSEYKNSELNKDYVPGQQDDDDFEKLIVEEFDLSLRKYITAINGEDMLAKEQSDDDSNNTQDENQENTEENKENIQEKTDENTDVNEEDTQDKTDENTDVNQEDTQDKTDEDTDVNEESTQDKTNGDTADEITYEREPVVNVKPLEENTTAKYTHPKNPVEVSVDDIVRYTISVYNEGTVSGYASLVKDDIPEGLQYVKDSEINKEFNWKLLDENNEETDDVTKAKYIVTDYLAKENGEDNIINAFDGEKLDTKFVQVEFKVIVKQDYPKIIVNQAQISNDTDESGKGVKDRDSVPNEWNDGEDDQDEEFIKVTYLDLSLRKFITKVNDQNITNRIPDVNATALIKETGTTAEYTHTKDPVLVHTTDKVTYTIRVYNEGSKDGYATVVKDDIPDGLEFIVDDETNKKYEWKLLDENGKEVTDASKAKYVVTDYLSKDNETNERQNLMKAFDKETMKKPEFKDVKVAFKVVEPTTSDRIVINEAQIAKQTDDKGIHREDRDSVPNEWNGEDDEDIEQIKVKYFDLSLRKWVTKAIVVQNGQTFETETGHKAEDNPEEIVKVDLKKSKIDSLVVKFEYQIRVTNEGEVAGYATEIKDYIPEGLKFDQADNTNWVQVEDNVITTDQLKDTLLQPNESAEVTVILTWINSETNMGTKVNVAEISKDYNEYNTPDIDSTPNNKVDGEDDIDDAPVMLTVKTGSNNLRYILIALGVLAILGLGVSLIKETVKSKKS